MLVLFPVRNNVQKGAYGIKPVARHEILQMYDDLCIEMMHVIYVLIAIGTCVL